MASVTEDVSSEHRHSELNAWQLDEAAPAVFRIRDLPEELQAQIVSSCLPDWSYALLKPPCPICMKSIPPGYTCFRIAHQPPTKVYGGAQHESPWRATSLQLVSRHFNRLVEAQYRGKFTGCLYVDPSVVRLYPRYCTCQRGSYDEAQSHHNVFKSVTTLHVRTVSIIGFDLDLLPMLPRLKFAVTRCNGTLFDGNLYGFGEEKFFIRVVSKEKLKDLMLAKFSGWCVPTRQNLKHLWHLGIKTVVEMTVAMGSPPMKFEFMCIFLLRQDEDPTVLGKFTLREWETSVRLRTSLYNKTWLGG